jgi:IclR family acetate operon transcriptional repressor
MIAHPPPPSHAPNAGARRDTITSLQRGLQILELLADSPEGLLAKTISARSGLNLSTCYHLLNTLVAAGYVVKPHGTQRFGLSGKLCFPHHGGVEGAALVPLLTPQLQALRDRTQETVYLSLRDGDEIVVGAFVEGSQALRVSLLHIGYAGANHATAIGKAVLAHLDDYDVTAYLARRGMPALTPATITEPLALKRELVAVRARGHSLDLEEFAEGVCCVGAPVFGPAGRVVASLGIPMPASRFRAGGEAVAAQVREAAAAATRALAIISLAGPGPGG